MLKVVLYTLGYGALFRFSFLSFENLYARIRYGSFPYVPPVRKIVYSPYTPFCLALGYARFIFNEPIIDFLIKKTYCNCN